MVLLKMFALTEAFSVPAVVRRSFQAEWSWRLKLNQGAISYRVDFLSRALVNNFVSVSAHVE